MARSPRVPSLSRHKSSGQACVRLADPARGGARRTIYIGAYGSPETRDDYAKVVADLLAGRTITPPATGGRTGADDITRLSVAVLLEKYQEHAKRYYKKNGRATSESFMISRAKSFLIAHHGDLAAGDFDIGDLKNRSASDGR